MEKELWTTKNDKLIKDFIINNIENNDYYTNIKKEYDNSKDKEQIINDILYCFESMFNTYYSIYTILDSIEQNMYNTTIRQTIEDENFEIKGEN